MINQLTNLNWVSVFAAFVAIFILGYIWYNRLFDKLYKLSLGKENQTLPTTPIFIIGPAVCCAVYTVTSAIFIYALDIVTYSAAMEFACVAGIGYLFTNTVNIAINPNIPRPFLYGAISGGYFFVGITIVTLILVTMK